MNNSQYIVLMFKNRNIQGICFLAFAKHNIMMQSNYLGIAINMVLGFIL